MKTTIYLDWDILWFDLTNAVAITRAASRVTVGTGGFSLKILVEKETSHSIIS